MNPMEMMIARGRSLLGFFISSPTVFRLVQPSYAHRDANVANPIREMAPVMPPPSALVPSMERLMSTELSPRKIPRNIISTSGIIPGYHGEVLESYSQLCTAEIYSGKYNDDEDSNDLYRRSLSPCVPLKLSTAAIAREAIDPEHVRMKHENPLINPRAG